MMETFVGERQESYFEPEDSDGARGSSDSNLSEKEDEVADRVERDDTKRVGRQDGESLKEILQSITHHFLSKASHSLLSKLDRNSDLGWLKKKENMSKWHRKNHRVKGSCFTDDSVGVLVDVLQKLLETF